MCDQMNIVYLKDRRVALLHYCTSTVELMLEKALFSSPAATRSKIAMFTPGVIGYYHLMESWINIFQEVTHHR